MYNLSVEDITLSVLNDWLHNPNPECVYPWLGSVYSSVDDIEVALYDEQDGTYTLTIFLGDEQLGWIYLNEHDGVLEYDSYDSTVASSLPQPNFESCYRYLLRKICNIR